MVRDAIIDIVGALLMMILSVIDRISIEREDNKQSDISAAG